MELIKKTGWKWSKTGHDKRSHGAFLCPYCNNRIEKDLHSGKRDKSCGCMLGKHGITHGDTGKDSQTRFIYELHQTMLARCFNPKHKSYLRYGGRGITVCTEWIPNLYFRKWALEHGIKKGLQIDRIDNDGNYQPDNCRFVTCAQNIRNTSTVKLNWDKVKYIRELHQTGLYTQRLLSRMFQVSFQNINLIVNNKRWVEQS